MQNHLKAREFSIYDLHAETIEINWSPQRWRDLQNDFANIKSQLEWQFKIVCSECRRCLVNSMNEVRWASMSRRCIVIFYVI